MTFFCVPAVPDASDRKRKKGPVALMRLALPGVLLLTVSACSSTEARNDLVQCTDPRPEICTMDYTPVCAMLMASGTEQWKTYSNACSACADTTVSGYRQNACPNDD